MLANVSHVSSHLWIGHFVLHDAATLGVTPAAPEDVGVLVHAERVAAAASLGFVPVALHVARGVAELVGVVGIRAAEALNEEGQRRKGKARLLPFKHLCTLVSRGATHPTAKHNTLLFLEALNGPCFNKASEK